MYSLIVRIVEDAGEAEDVMQEVFSQAWRQSSRFDATRGSVAAWLLMMARSRAVDRLRGRRAQPDGAQAADDRVIIDMPDPAVGPEAAMLSEEQIERLRAASIRSPSSSGSPSSSCTTRG